MLHNARWRHALIATALTAAASLPAAAWGPDGHQTVGAIADQLIAGTPTGKKVRKILGSTLQTASAWADCARAVELRKGQWRYMQTGVYADCRMLLATLAKDAGVG